MEYSKQYLYKRIVLAKAFIDANYQTNINLTQIISEAHFSKFHFIRLFKSVYGLSPHQYLMQKRVRQAKMELKENDNSILDVCFNVGFQSHSSFTHLFKRQTNKTPLQYRYQAKANKIKGQKEPISLVPGCYALKHFIPE
jgi:AraC-like DNA-binding protein